MVSSEVSYDDGDAIVAEQRAFDETKAGVKGLVESGITSVPRLFIHHRDNHQPTAQPGSVTVPTIDLHGVRHDATRRSQAIQKIKHASQTWGFFQVVNHGIPVETMDEALVGVRAFFEQDDAVKRPYYTRDMAGKRVVYNSNFDLYTRRGAADWRDTFFCMMAPKPLNKEELPEPCREPLFEYGSRVMGLGKLLLELMSDGLGLGPDKLLGLGCADGLSMLCHYYPPCPEPEKTMGTTKHQDNDFITLLLQDKEIGGLQVMYEGQWLDVPPLPGAIVVNIGDFLQDFAGSPGTVTGLALRISQCVFAAGSFAFMVSSPGFYKLTGFCFLVASMGLQVTWSLTLALLDTYALVKKIALRSPVLISLFVVGDWVTGTLSLSAASACAGITILYFNDVGVCVSGSECSKFQFSVVLAFLSWIMIYTSSLIMFWLLASSG